MENTKKSQFQIQKIQTTPYKGVRDFYPEEMYTQNYIFSVMRKTLESFGYSEYNSSVLEPAELYRAKTGEEIVNEQTYTFKDRGDREVTLRPEMTPSLARMIAAKKRTIPYPIRWYSIPNLFRYENPQKGRLREHWQLNADIFGEKGIEAEVEIISIANSLLKNFGLKQNQYEIRINNRKIINYILLDLFKLDHNKAHTVSKILDKKNKINTEEFKKKIFEILAEKTEHFLQIINSKNFEELVVNLGINAEKEEGIKEVKMLMEKLDGMNMSNVVFYQSLMRGFDYYTGIVFEIFDTNTDNPRSIFGGGRYDDLLDIFGSEKIPAVGMGAGDVIIKDVLETYGLLPEYKNNTKLYVCVTDNQFLNDAMKFAEKLREDNINVSVNLTEKKVGDQIKYADKNKIPFVVCIGENEIKDEIYKIKKLETGEEISLKVSKIAEFLNKP